MSERTSGDVLEVGEVRDPMVGRRLVTRQLQLDKPIVCAINGDCVGLAATHALLSDAPVMSEAARIGDSPVNKVGLVAGDGSTVIWPLVIGVNKAKETLMRGTLLNGREVERIGLVNHCVPAGQVMERARAIAQELADGPTWAIRWTKLSINQIVKEGARQSPARSVDGTGAADLRDGRSQGGDAGLQGNAQAEVRRCLNAAQAL